MIESEPVVLIADDDASVRKSWERLVRSVEKTVKVHRARVMQKMRVHSVAQLVLLAEKVGLTAPQDLSALDQSLISTHTFHDKLLS